MSGRSQPSATSLGPDLPPKMAANSMNFYFVDFEASSLDSGSFPVEVAWVNEIGQGESHLIRPEPTWTNWSAQSEEIHGISRTLLLQQGKPADWVAHRALIVLRGATLVSDNPAFDVYWLSMLFKVIWDKTEIEMVDLQSVIGQVLQRLSVLNEAEVDSSEWHRRAAQLSDEGRVLAASIIEAETRRQRTKHRALQDAEYLWRCWQAVQHGVDQVLLNQSFDSFKTEGLHPSAMQSVCPTSSSIQLTAANPSSDCPATGCHLKRSDKTCSEGLQILKSCQGHA